MAVRRFAHVCATMLRGGRPDVAPLEACWPTMGVIVRRFWSTLVARWPRDFVRGVRRALPPRFSCGAAAAGHRSGEAPVMS
ncbi:hypothetical protein F511_45480 [Dorcoceras hygrometricum]|uniref:Uncharacterized protein n=1 Tax=Dorcoceras hygrometricum TaxID=472368 RepID=A0A2Z6ZVT4_9LAMI|nr:hypothetical protein F511_45480 [Dorcoceras hygrometricum]